MLSALNTFSYNTGIQPYVTKEAYGRPSVHRQWKFAFYFFFFFFFGGPWSESLLLSESELSEEEEEEDEDDEEEESESLLSDEELEESVLSEDESLLSESLLLSLESLAFFLAFFSADSSIPGPVMARGLFSISFSFFFISTVLEGLCTYFLFPVHSYVQCPISRHF